MDQNEALNSINSDLIRGHIDTIILKALQAGDRYGYDIIKEIEHKSDGQYVIKQPTLYSCLKRLEVQGFVKSYWGSKSIGGRKKYFTLTDMGRELFVRNKSDWDYSRTVIDKLISDENYISDDAAVAQTTEDVKSIPTDEPQNDFLDIEVVEDEDDEDEPIYAQSPDEETANDEDENDTFDEDEDEQPIDVLPMEIDDEEDERVQSDDEPAREIDEDDEDEDFAVVDTFINDYDLDEEYDRRLEKVENALRNDDDDEDYSSVFYDEDSDKSDSGDDEPDENSLIEQSDEPLHEEEITDGAFGAEEENVDELPLSASEQVLSDGLPDETDADDNELVNKAYYEQRQESYIDNVDNSKYEPITQYNDNNDNIDINNYFADIDEGDDDVAATSEIINASPQEPYEEPPKPEFPNVRKFVRETPENKTVFYSYKHSDIPLDERTAVIDKEYRFVINKLISDNIVSSKPTVDLNETPNYDEAWGKQTASDSASSQPTAQPEEKTDVRSISETITRETGENVGLRTYSDKSLKTYNRKHYYYCNQLRLMQYGILFGIMMLEIVLCFFFIEFIHNGMNISRASLAVYIAAVIVSAAFPVAAFFMSSGDYNKRKRINYSGKTSAIFSIVVTLLLSLIVFFINIYGGILINDFNNYLSTLIMPIILSTNVITNAIIFHILYKSGKYNVSD